MHHLLFPTTTIITLLLLLLSPPILASTLTTTHYHHSCPNLHRIVSQVVTKKQLANPSTAAGTLRLFFHDCFVGGCDASVLLSSSPSHPTERDADINHSLPGDAFDVVLRLKSSLDLHCPSAHVSCSDTLALAARHLLILLGGPNFPLPLGRLDSTASSSTYVPGNLPRVNMSIDGMIALFARKGFSVREMVALSGAHTVGFAHCSEFANRIYGYNGGGEESFDPGLDPRFAQGLQRACRDYLKVPALSTFNDVMTPAKFDNMYFLNLVRGLGLLDSDHAMVVDARTRMYVEMYARNQTVFFEDFGRAMEKLSLVGVKTGGEGVIRRQCDRLN